MSQHIIAPLLLLLLLALAGCTEDAPEPEASAADTPQTATQVEAAQASAKPEMRSSDTFVAQSAARRSTLTGFTRARNAMTLVAEESGRVETVLADVGDVLGADGRFAVLDATFVRLDLASNRADQERLRSDVDFHKKEMDRYAQLVETRTAAQSTLDSNVRAHQSALQQLRAMQIHERILAERIERFSIVGPPGWQVVTRYVEPGEWINTGEQVAELGRYDVLLAPFALTSAEYRALQQKGDAVNLSLTDLGVAVPAKVERVSPGFDPQTRKIAVDLEITEGDFEFRGGLRVELVIDLPDPGGAVLVPKTALVKAYEEYFLMTPEGERVRVVLLGSADDGMRRVTGADVSPGDSFLVQP